MPPNRVMTPSPTMRTSSIAMMAYNSKPPQEWRLRMDSSMTLRLIIQMMRMRSGPSLRLKPLLWRPQPRTTISQVICPEPANKSISKAQIGTPATSLFGCTRETTTTTSTWTIRTSYSPMVTRPGTMTSTSHTCTATTVIQMPIPESG